MNHFKHLIFLFLFLSIVSISGFAQVLSVINGKVASAETQVDLSGATVSLLNAADSTTVKNTTTARNGSFELKMIPAGNYFLAVTHTDFQKTYSRSFTVKPGEAIVSIPPVQLNTAAKTLAGVTVTGKKSFIEHKVDRTVLNVDASITNTGSTALDVLENAPGVIVDKDGNISLKGKEGVLIMIDGRPAQLGGEDLANYLRGMSSNQLDQIEIMTNPPARFDASGTAGVINIKTKKNKAAGYNGSFTLGYGQGRYPKANEGFNFNYRKGKINFFTNLSHNFNKGYEVISINR
ncbi:MAG TPA: TonB-dependent receptor, partial [Chitinophagaceae bacterium]